MKKLLLLAALATALIAPARADYLIRDGAGVTQTIRSGVVTVGPNAAVILPWSTPTDPTGVPYAAANPLPVVFGTGALLPAFSAPPHFICDSGCTTSGSTGTDSSVNAASIPADSNNILLTTIPVNASRARVGVQNQAAATLQVVRDDGAGANQTSVFLTGVYMSWESATFKGRIRIYGPSGTPVAAYQD